MGGGKNFEADGVGSAGVACEVDGSSLPPTKINEGW